MASLQAVRLQIAVTRVFGAADYAKLDPLTISMPHPEAAQAIITGKGEITAHKLFVWDGGTRRFVEAPFTEVPA